MKVVILAGGMGTRISEETSTRPKPMIEIGGRPILWHIMKLYAHHGLNDFVICLGYKGYMIKEYFMNFVLHHSDVTIDAAKNSVTYHQSNAEPWRITLVDTGEATLTGGRLKRVRNYLDPDEPFCFTYGDGLSDVDIAGTVAFHKEHGKVATVTAVRPPGRYGALEIEGSSVKCPHQRRVLCTQSWSYRSGRWRSDLMGIRASRSSGARQPACGLSPLRFLAADGYAAR